MTDQAAPGMRETGRVPFDRIGVAVLKELVETIVSGGVQPGETLPPEAILSREFGVSRTVIRESMKRLQEKGMVTVAQGRGTHVNQMSAWNLLDPLVLASLIGHDDALGVLDDLSIVRGALESVMAGAVADRCRETDIAVLRAHLDVMRENIANSAEFRAADVRFHLAMMDFSENLLAANVARVLYERALESSRYHGVDPEHAFEITVLEHERILQAVIAGDSNAAKRAMDEHILGSWDRRRLPRTRRGRDGGEKPTAAVED